MKSSSAFNISSGSRSSVDMAFTSNRGRGKGEGLQRSADAAPGLVRESAGPAFPLPFPPSPFPFSFASARRAIRGEHLHVVGALEGRRVGDVRAAQASDHLVDGDVLVLRHPTLD